MSLRARLIVSVLGLTVAVLAAVNVATYASVRQFLFERVDGQLEAAVPPATFELTRIEPTNPAGATRPRPVAPILPPGTYIELRGPDGAVANTITFGFGETGYLAPALPETLLPPAERQWTEASASDGSDYRVLVAPIPKDARAVVIAIPLGDVDDTLQRLVFIELGGSGIALLFILGGTLLLVRLGLRPLDRFAATADEIAAGDLSRRVSPADRRTEVGRLGSALNRMLSHIEEAFRQKTESEQRLRRFVADASHELRTPLTSIRGFAELVSDRPGLSPEDATNAARRIEQQSDRMARLVDDLLLLARLDEGQELSFEDFEFGNVVRGAVDEARAADPSRTITADLARATVRGDALRLHQAVANLLANARQHTPPGTHIDVKLGTDGRTAKLVVEDTGPGLAEADLPHLFDRFYRADKSRSRQNGGSGLGLAIVKSIIEGHGGTVQAQPGTRKGARLVITLPAGWDE